MRGVDLTVRPREAVALVGESGSGKSMTARSVLRLLPDGARLSGDLRFRGDSILGMGDSRLRMYRAREVGMIFQDPRAHINPVRTVGDFALEALRRTRSRAESERIILELFDATRIDHGPDRLKQFPHELSGGQLQRVMIAAAVATEPRLLIADEPTTALDVTTQAEVIGILNELRQTKNMGLLFITHDLELAAAVCDRTVVMYAGSIAEEQPAESLHSNPLHPYAAGLIGARPDIFKRQTRLRAIRGRPIAAHEAPIGCPFAPRCDFARKACTETTPVPRPIRDGTSACIRAEALLDVLAGIAADPEERPPAVGERGL